jgi:hypothetical protein
MGSTSLIPAEYAAIYQSALDDVFWTFARPFQMYVEAQTATISTSNTYSRFGQHDQNAAINADNSAVTPQVYTVTGCILYGNTQPWKFTSPGDVGDLKIRESDGIVRIKVETVGYNLLKNCQMVRLDGFDFQLQSNARPHGLVGQPTRFTFTLDKID